MIFQVFAQIYGLYMILSRAKNIFMPANVNSNVNSVVILYCNLSLSDNDFVIESKYDNSFSSCFNPYPRFHDPNL